ncbi:MAG: ADP-forming succinate--CoA ligase subunit beta, partial [Spirochaetaceae bacterium]|nr:ADP-forming succinate--CoA ligase subunit beta [Spirochaetaceae bacterium]
EARQASVGWKQTVVKAQVLAGGRGKAGGVKLADTPEEVEEKAGKILGLEIKGYPVEKILVCDAAPIAKEHYLGMVLDRAKQGVTLMLTDQGGVDIEDLAVSDPDAIHKITLYPHRPLDDAALKSFLAKSIPEENQLNQAMEAAKSLFELFKATDASLAEINPYALTPDGEMLALDGKVNFDDNALFRHPEIAALRNPEEESQDEIEAREKNLSFVSLDGDIGCVVNGAGLAMATMDIIKHYGGDAANFLDVGGSSDPQKVAEALKIILRNPRVNAVLINIFGGITRCDDIANGLLIARKELDFKVPLVIRLVGTNQDEGRAILEKAGLKAGDNLDEAVKSVIEAAKERS